jgi:hypothetical protein
VMSFLWCMLMSMFVFIPLGNQKLGDPKGSHLEVQSSYAICCLQLYILSCKQEMAYESLTLTKMVNIVSYESAFIFQQSKIRYEVWQITTRARAHTHTVTNFSECDHFQIIYILTTYTFCFYHAWTCCWY